MNGFSRSCIAALPHFGCFSALGSPFASSWCTNLPAWQAPGQLARTQSSSSDQQQQQQQEQQPSSETHAEPMPKLHHSSLIAEASGRQQRVFVNPELLAHISSTINRLTGYAGIEHLKAGVGATDSALLDTKRQMQAAKAEYEAQLAKQSQLHREVTALLQRKSSWVPADVARFTDLYAAEHATEQAVAAAKAHYSRLSDDVEQLQLQLMDLIRERYQQEQLWSDKIRRASTWWTWGLMGLHFASFVLVYTVLEPHKRQALQDAVAGMLQEQAAALDARLAPLAMAVVAATAAAEVQFSGGSNGSGGGLPQQVMMTAQQHETGGVEQRSAAAGCAAATKQRRQQQQQQQLSPELEQTVLQELQRVQQQLQHLQQSLPGVAAAAASSAAADVQAQQQQQWRSWHLPGSGWASKQLTAAGASAAAAWQRTKQGVQQAALFRQASNSASSSSSSSKGVKTGEEQAKQQLEGAAIGAESPPAKPEAAAAEPQAAVDTGSSPRALLQQLEAGSGVLEVSKGQLAAVAGSAFAAGAGVAAVVLLLLSAGGGKGSC